MGFIRIAGILICAASLACSENGSSNGSASGNGGSAGASSGGSAGSGASSDGGSSSGGVGDGGAPTGGAITGGGGTSGTGVTGGSGGSMPTPTCFLDAGTPAGNAIDLALTPSRTSGVAPLAVFFDVQGTTADATMRPFHDLAYCWDFGDADSGSFVTTGLSKNHAKGPVSGHVFETPGTYSVNVLARDAMGRVASASVEIIVEDPEAVFAGDSTVCLSQSGDFDGCPSGAQEITGAALSALSASVQPGMRLLLRRGENFTGSLALNVQGPGHVGAFGPSTEPRPLISGGAEVFFVSAEEPDFSDWRISDVEVTGTSDQSEVVYVGGKATDLLILRVRGTNIGSGIAAPDSIINYWNANGSPGHDVIDVLAIQDSEIRDLVGGQGHNLSYIAAHRLMMLGNVYQNSVAGEHVIRTPWIDRGVLSSNDIGEADTPRHLLKMHAPGFTSPGVGNGKYTEWVVLSDNVFRCTGGHDWSVGIGPQNDSSDERVRDVLVERNLFLPGPEAQVALMLWGQDITVRDNLFDRGPQRQCVGGGQRGIEPASRGITLLHNTCVAETGPTLAAFDSSTQDLTLYNNLAVGPAASLGSPVSDEAGNLLTMDASFVGNTLMSAADFALQASSPAVDSADRAHATAWDFFGRPRPVDGDGSGDAEPDVGAAELEP